MERRDHYLGTKLSSILELYPKIEAIEVSDLYCARDWCRLVEYGTR